MLRPLARCVHRDLYLVYIGVKQRLFYGSATVISLVTNIFFVALQYYLWRAIYSTNDIAAIRFEATFSYLVVTQIIASVYPISAGNYVGEEMRSGDIVMLLIRPMTIFRRVLLNYLGGACFRIIVVALPTLFFSALFFGVNFYWANFMPFLVVFILAYIQYFIFEMIIGCISFYTKSIWGIQNLKYALFLVLTARAIPLALYPPTLRNIVLFLPFSNMFALVANVLSGEEFLNIGHILDLGFTIIIAYGIYLGVMWLSRRHIAIQGG